MVSVGFLSYRGCKDVLVKGSIPLTREGALEPALAILPTAQ